MFKKALLIVSGLVLVALTIGLAVAGIINSIIAPNKTQVIFFQPTLSTNDKIVSGNCWTNSIAIGRQGAWRCMVGNGIYDPCFSTSDPNKVVCGVDPLKDQKGFVIQLTKPLPVLTDKPSPLITWLVELTDGTVCSPNTGSRPIVGELAVQYGCTGSGRCNDRGVCRHMVGLVDIYPQSGKLWVAQKVTFSTGTSAQPDLVLEKSQIIAIKRAWQ